MTRKRTEKITNTLAQSQVHDQWIADYRTDENAAFYEEAFDFICQVLSAPKDTVILDAGCGTGAHAIRLWKRGFRVRAVDFSKPALERAARNVIAAGADDRIDFQQEDLLSLSFPDCEFKYALCWGVLMHIHEIEKAVSELARVLTPGGMLVISEGNMKSLHSVGLRNVKSLLGKQKATTNREPAGLEYWSETPAGTLLTRHADIGGLETLLRENHLEPELRASGQFTELYTHFRSAPMRRAVHALNRIWFRHINLPQLAFGNILFFRKSDSQT